MTPGLPTKTDRWASHVYPKQPVDVREAPLNIRPVLAAHNYGRGQLQIVHAHTLTRPHAHHPGPRHPRASAPEAVSTTTVADTVSPCT